jgi:hypothetical protein
VFTETTSFASVPASGPAAVVATGNHFFVDAAAGAFVVGLAAGATVVLTRQPTTARAATALTRGEPSPAIERRAA